MLFLCDGNRMSISLPVDVVSCLNPPSGFSADDKKEVLPLSLEHE